MTETLDTLMSVSSKRGKVTVVIQFTFKAKKWTVILGLLLVGIAVLIAISQNNTLSFQELVNCLIALG